MADIIDTVLWIVGRFIAGYATRGESKAKLGKNILALVALNAISMLLC